MSPRPLTKVSTMPESLYQQQNKQTGDNRTAVSQRKAGRVLIDNRDVALQRVLEVNAPKKMQAIASNSLFKKEPAQLKQNQKSVITSQSVVQLANEWGLNDYNQINAFTDSLYENLGSEEQAPAMIKVSAMMLSINKNLHSLGYPGMEIVVVKDLENTGTANFDFRTWKMQIDKSKLVVNAKLANTLYHEARHSEQWFKMIARRLLKGEGKIQIVDEMHVPEHIVADAIKIGPKKILPQEQAEAVNGFHESVYGSGQKHRGEVLSDVSHNYKKYRELPEEVDAWEVGGNVEMVMDVDANTLTQNILKSDDLVEIRKDLSKLNFLIDMLPNGENKVRDVLREKLAQWHHALTGLQQQHSDKGSQNLMKYLSLAENYNKLAGQAKVDKVFVPDAKSISKDMENMTNNLLKAKRLDKKNPDIWAVGKLIQYIEDCMNQYDAEIIKPGKNSSKWCVMATAKFVDDIKQAIIENKNEQAD